MKSFCIVDSVRKAAFLVVLVSDFLGFCFKMTAFCPFSIVSRKTERQVTLRTRSTT
uniref:Uncharacterized protein n=1 Tax=Rhizophora mucronata TaxID=61149 RepID=A0A2P2LWI3_RHIMU